MLRLNLAHCQQLVEHGLKLAARNVGGVRREQGDY